MGNQYTAEICSHYDIVEDWTAIFNECKTTSVRSRKVNEAIKAIREHLVEIRDAVYNRDGWYFGRVYTIAHIRSSERELMFLMEYKNQLQHAKVSC